MVSQRETRKRKAVNRSNDFLDVSFSESEMDFSFQQPPAPSSTLNGNSSRGRVRGNGRVRGSGSSTGRGRGNNIKSTRPSLDIVVPNTPPRPQSNNGGNECYIFLLVFLSNSEPANFFSFRGINEVRHGRI